MAQIIETEVFEEDGVKYQRDIYDSGAVITYPWVDPDAPIPEPEPMPEPPTENEAILLSLSEIYEQNEQIRQDNEALMMAVADLYAD